MSEEEQGLERVMLHKCVYSKDRRGSLRLYVFDREGFHSGGSWFGVNCDDPDISVARARQHVQLAIEKGLEVRITNASDFLVFHSVDGKVVYPAKPEDAAAFWVEVAS